MGKGLSAIRIDFSKVASKTLGEIFGSQPVPATHIGKKMWEVIKANNLRCDGGGKKAAKPSAKPAE